MRSQALLAAVTLCALGAIPVVAQSPRTDPRDFVVTTEWLAAHRADRDLVLVHVVQDTADRSEQIPGSRRLWYRALVTTRDGVSSELPAVDTIRAALERLGVTNRSHVVVYASEAPMATRLLFTLDYMGHDRLSFLDGGLRKWMREGRAVTAVAESPAPSTFTPHPRAELVASAQYVSDHLAGPGLALIDTRTTDEYLGTSTSARLPSAGHLAGARQLEWQELFSDAEFSTLRSRDTLEKMYAERVRPSDTVVTYCWVGYRGSATYFVARYLGYDVKLYDGSYQDWAQRKLPVRTGAAP